MRIILTGSSSGIGHSIAEHLLETGHSVWGIARSDQRELIKKYPNTFHSSRCDVSKWDDVAQTVKTISAAWPSIDAIVCCAGIQGEIGPAVTMNPTNWSNTVRANLDGTYFVIRGFYELLKPATGRKKIVCFSGGGSTKSRANFSAYGVAKTGVVRLVETIAEELRHEPLDINAVAPGAINTRLTDEVIALGPQVVGEAEYQSALKQKAQGGESLQKAIGLVDYLLSPASDGISGRLISAPWDPWPTLP